MAYAYWPIALAEARQSVTEAQDNWRAGNHWGAVSNLFVVLDRCERILKEEAPLLVQDVLTAMLAGDSGDVERACRELAEYCRTPGRV